jgi:hypothetical protein
MAKAGMFGSGATRASGVIPSMVMRVIVALTALAPLVCRAGCLSLPPWPDDEPSGGTLKEIWVVRHG